MNNNCNKLISDHSRHWRDNQLVYPVISRRSKGLSIGVNLSPGGKCNFRCVYCQVNRDDGHLSDKAVELSVVIRELNALLDMVAEGDFWEDEKFSQTPDQLRRLNDIAFSGDGEPTLSPRFADAVTIAADALKRHGFAGVKLVVITNATRLHTKNFRRAVDTLLESKGQLWCKLDAGGQDRYAAVNRSAVPLTKICDNIAEMAKIMPVAIQTCLFNLDGSIPDDIELEMYCNRIADILRRGGKIEQIQLYSVVRPPAESFVKPLTNEQMQYCAQFIAEQLPQLRLDIY